MKNTLPKILFVAFALISPLSGARAGTETALPQPAPGLYEVDLIKEDIATVAQALKKAGISVGYNLSVPLPDRSRSPLVQVPLIVSVAPAGKMEQGLSLLDPDSFVGITPETVPFRLAFSPQDGGRDFQVRLTMAGDKSQSGGEVLTTIRRNVYFLVSVPDVKKPDGFQFLLIKPDWKTLQTQAALLVR